MIELARKLLFDENVALRFGRGLAVGFGAFIVGGRLAVSAPPLVGVGFPASPPTFRSLPRVHR
mgnify:CR=1 FL=1